jgi:hypothetical protein
VDPRYGLSLSERNRCEPLAYDGTLEELVDVINADLAIWAAERASATRGIGTRI